MYSCHADVLATVLREKNGSYCGYVEQPIPSVHLIIYNVTLKPAHSSVHSCF